MEPLLLVIDMQRAIDADYWAKDGPRNNRNAERTGIRLLAAWRSRGWPVIHVRHDSVEPQSAYRPGQPGNDFKDGFRPEPGESVFAKHTGSAFTNTGLADHLRALGIEALAILGVITNNSVETTVRHAATLGFRVQLIEDACFTFARRDFRGQLHSAETVHAMSLANLDAEYCSITTAAELLAAIGGDGRLILPYFERSASHEDHDPRSLAAAQRIPGFEHVGSTSVPGCPGKGILDGIVLYAPGKLNETVTALYDLGFQPQPGRDPWPPARPMLVGAIVHEGTVFRVHAHVLDATSPEVAVMRGFRDRLRADPSLVAAYAARKREILASGVIDSVDYAEAKGSFVTANLSA